ncbi:MAG: Gfo/Idh/MocA family oxidoreductase [Armatimonadetes bacterium]|nr:Gfo/Idh/MocA family oxidoreductase [Armatimonadota bacterium]
MATHPTRRDVLRTSAAGAVTLALPVFGAAQNSPKSPQKVRFACIGVGGKGDSDTADANRLGVVVAICDADRNTLANSLKKYPDAKPYTDYRYMLQDMRSSIDAVTVSTPDHNHGLASAMAMMMGKHAFCQKPLTRTVWETRRLAELAIKHNLATQMGNQGTANDELRRAAMAVKNGAIGTVKEVHVWTDRAEGWWPQGVGHPMPDVKPASVDWDAWLGPAPVRHFSNAYHPFRWRGWWDFGAGAMGDMGCHVLNLPFMALDLRDPIAFRAEVSDHNDETYPRWSIIHYEFPERNGRAALKLTWYDGGKKPSQDFVPGVQYSGGGVIIVGSSGTLYVPSEHGSGATILGKGAPQADFEKSPGHFEEFIRAIEGGKPAMSNFPGYACPLTETVVLGNLAAWAPGDRLEWDAANMRVKGRSDLDAMLKPTYRKGWDY